MAEHEGGQWNVATKKNTVYLERVSEDGERLIDDSLAPEEARQLARLLTKSVGFGDARPHPIQRWDETIDSVNALSVDPSNPNWYGNAKAQAFLPRTLNDLASQFPPDVLVVRFTGDDAQPGSYRLVSVQPEAQSAGAVTKTPA